MSVLRSRILECLSRSGWDFDPPGPSDSFRDLGIDSLALALWVVEIERELGVKIPPAKLSFAELGSLEKVEALVESALGGKILAPAAKRKEKP